MRGGIAECGEAFGVVGPVMAVLVKIGAAASVEEVVAMIEVEIRWPMAGDWTFTQ